MKFRRWELVLAVTLLILMLMSVMPMQTQAELAGKMVRLHVIANSDSAEDQALKLAVRDRVLAEISPEDTEISDALLERMRLTAQAELVRRGCTYPVRVLRTNMYFDTRHYDGFSLPAGNYDAVRVVIGAGAGKNWWCVLFPPLCAGVSEQELDCIAKEAGLTDEELAFIKGDGTVYVVKFKLVELLSRLRNLF